MSAERMSNDFGNKLREARERKGMSLGQIARATKISVAALEALERNDISRLPGGIFSRAFVRSYAAEVGLDPEATIQSFIAQFPHESVIAGHAGSDQFEDAQALESDRRMAGTLLAILAISIPIAGALLYFGTFGYRAGSRMEPGGTPAPVAASAEPRGAAHPVEPASAGAVLTPSAPSGRMPTAAAVPTETAGSTPARNERAPGTPASTPVEVQPAQNESAAADAAPTATEATAHLMVGLFARRPVWISATVDGQKAIERLLQPGERRIIDVQREMVITAGDAAAISMTLNGADARALGKTGEVVTARLNLSNFREYLQSR